MANRVREVWEQSRKSLLDGTARQRLEESTRQLLDRSVLTISQLVGTSPPRPVEGKDVLAGVCSSIALRDLNLIDSLLEQLEKMEADEDDPDALARLYRLDHLVTRLRRNGENLRVLAGNDAGGGPDQTTSLVDVIRAGMSSIEHYTRIEMAKVAGLGVVGFAADDVGRLVSELLDNATRHAPPTSTVTVSAHLTEHGSVMVRIEDAGIGLPAARLQALNERLASAPVLDRNTIRHMGLAVVRRLASKHGIRVRLARRAPNGTIASVLLPATLLTEVPGMAGGRDHEAGPAPLAESQPPAGARGAVVPDGPPMRGTVFLDPAESLEPPGGSPTTVNGLPRRVPRSLKAQTFSERSAETAERSGQEQHDSHERLLADLDAFAEGEQQARTDAGGGHES